MADKTTVVTKDATEKIIDICRKAKSRYVRLILLGQTGNSLVTDERYEDALCDLESELRESVTGYVSMMHRVVNLAFLYIISKYTSIGMTVTSNCEARIDQAIANLYNAYNASDDVVKYVILNVALGLDANAEFLRKFENIAGGSGFYKDTQEYINIFDHIQEQERGSLKTKNLSLNSADKLYALLKKTEFICDLDIAVSDDYCDAKSAVMPCSFVIDGRSYPSKYALIKYSPNEYNDMFLFMRSMDEINLRDGNKALRLNYTKLGASDNGANTAVIVSPVEFEHDRDKLIITKSVGMFYSYVTGDLLRKRHRMSFCNGLSSYKYYGELVASIMDAFEMKVSSADKQRTIIENFILPVVQNNYNICKEDCVCLGTGCPFGAKDRLCNKERFIERKSDINVACLSNMDIVGILTILFSVVGCKEILPQIFAQYNADTSSLEDLFKKVNKQLEKRFSGFDSERVEQLYKEFFEMSIKYLSFDIDEKRRLDSAVAATLKPFTIRAYTDALVTVLENLDRDESSSPVNPSGNVYSIRNKIDLITGIKDVAAVRNTLRDTLKVILAYYAGLANCKQQQLAYEIMAEQATVLGKAEAAECERGIKDAFYAGVQRELNAMGEDPTFYTLFKMLVDDTEQLKDGISIMLGREMVNLVALKRYIALDVKRERCMLVEWRRRENGAVETLYECNLDDPAQCSIDKEKFVARVVELMRFFNGADVLGIRFACYPQVLTHTSSRVNGDNTTIAAFTAYESERYVPQKEYNVITYFSYDISKRYFYVAPKKFEKTRWITYPILVRCSEFYNKVIKERGNE